MTDTIAWYLAVQVAAVAIWPLVRRALPMMDDYGWSLAKTGGLLALAWLTWFVCMLAPVPYARLTIVTLLLATGLFAWIRETPAGIAVAVAQLRARWRMVAVVEAVFGLAFVYFALMRAHQPAIAAFEKPMDMAFLNGLVAAQRLPTQDSWLSGFGQPYYYFGYVIFATAIKLAGIGVGPGFNLAAATIPALAVVSLGTLIWSVTQTARVSRSWRLAGAAAGTFLALVAGNLRAFFEMSYSFGFVPAEAGGALGIKGFGEQLTRGTWPPDGSWWFASSRVVPNLQPDGINEFPFFTAYLSDLHPHFLALPLEVAALACAAAMLRGGENLLRSRWSQSASALVLGGLLTTNTWDIAPFWLLYVISCAIASAGMVPRDRVMAVLAAPLLGVVLFAPYFVSYHGPPLGVGITSQQTPLATFLVLFGPLVVVLGGIGIWQRSHLRCARDRNLAIAGGVAGIVLGLVGQPTIGLLIALLAVLIPMPWNLAHLNLPEFIAMGLGAFAIAMLLGVELIYLDDIFHSRMNTTFKFHENVWLLGGFAAGVGFAAVGGWKRRWRVAITTCASIGMLTAVVYPVSATITRLREKPPYGVTLDGMAFLPAEERAAIRWLSDQQRGGRLVIVEAVGGEYSDYARFATFAGAATLLGWAGHELQWRGPIPELSRRETAVASIFRDGSLVDARGLLKEYAVTYVVVGRLEREKYGAQVDDRFTGALPLAFRYGRTAIYRAT